MLTKLMKYDIRSTWRDFAGVYLSILLGVMIVPQLFNHFDHKIATLLGGFLAAGIMIATVVVMVVMLFRIFNRNVFSKEGYLTMTLPATSLQIVASKLLVSVMWIVLTGIVSIIGICIFALNLNAAPPAEIIAGIQKIMSVIDGRGALAIMLFLVMMIASAVKEIAKLFLACSVAHLKQLGRFRVLLGILSYFLFSWMEVLIVQTLSFMASFLPFADDLAGRIELIHDPASIQQFIGLFSGVMATSIFYAAVLTAVYAAGTVWILNRKLDLG